MGGLKRLSVAVVVNYKRGVDKNGKPAMVPLSEAEKTQIGDLVKEAMGFNKDRGESLNVVNSAFAAVEPEPQIIAPLWKRPETLSMSMEIGKCLLAAIALLYLFLAFLKPMLKQLCATNRPRCICCNKPLPASCFERKAPPSRRESGTEPALHRCPAPF